MRKNKYTLQFNSIDTMVTGEIEITEKAFAEQLEKLTGQVIDSVEYEYPVTHTVKTFETESYKSTQHHFNCGCSDIWITAIKCKDGYYFKKVT